MIPNESISIGSAATEQANVRTSRIKEWAQILSGYLAAQTGIQVVAFFAGLLLVNFLPVREYALYTLGLSAFSFLTLICDLGITSAIPYFRRESAAEGQDAEPYVRSALHLRRSLFLIASAGLLIFFPIIGMKRGFGAGEVFVVAAAIGLSAWFQIRASLQLMVLRLDGKYGRSYIAELLGTMGRLVLSVIFLVSGLLFGWLMVLVNALGSIVTAAASWLPIAADKRSTTASKNIFRYMLPTLPNALYFSIQGPLVIWLSAYFGRAENIAQVGALGRLALVMGLVTNFIGFVIVPRLAVVTSNSWYLKRYLQYWIPVLGIAAALTTLGIKFPALFLFLLGKNYSTLENEFGIVAISVALKLCETYILTINSARGWNRWQAVALIFYVISQAFLIVRLDLSTTAGVLMFGLFSNLAGFLLQVPINVLGFLRPSLVKIRMSHPVQEDVP